MPIFLKEVSEQYINNNGHKKTAFQIIKGKDGVIQKIDGRGNDEKLNITETFIHQTENGRVAVKRKAYRIKASNLKNIMNHSSLTKKIKETKPTKLTNKKVKSTKSTNKKVKSSKSIKSTDKKIKSTKSTEKKIKSTKSTNKKVKSTKFTEKK